MIILLILFINLEFFSKHINIYLNRSELINIWNKFILAWNEGSTVDEFSYSVVTNKSSGISLSLVSICSVFILYKYWFANNESS